MVASPALPRPCVTVMAALTCAVAAEAQSTGAVHGRVYNVAAWGVRVPEATYEAVRRDKQDNGIIESDILGEKMRGEIEPR